jgi:catechol 2,3-dioxygenase-like lactoylglutathione lyase family enzyme
MSEIEGIGGVFLFSEDPAKLSDWYADHLGMEFEFRMESGTSGLTFHAVDPAGTGTPFPTIFSIMQASVPMPARAGDPQPESPYGDARVMVNFRTRELDKLLDRLAKRGVLPTGREDSEYGAFTWIYDGDGNRIELWQPPAELLAD